MGTVPSTCNVGRHDLRSTGYSAFELVYGQDCLLPVDFSPASWSVVDWEGETQTRDDLLVARMRQLDEQTLRVSRAATELERSRKHNKGYFDQHNRMRAEPQRLHVGDLVLLFQSKNLNTRLVKNKLHDLWFGPYRIREIPDDLTFYKLEELDGAHLKATFARNRLKRFSSGVELDTDRADQHAVIRVRDALEDDEADVPALEDLEEDLGTVQDLAED